MLRLFKKTSLTSTVYKVDNLPYLFQSEYYSLAWGMQHRGFYIPPDGTKYSYDMPESWDFHISEKANKSDAPFKSVKGIELDGVIQPEQLFQNLAYSKKQSSLFGRKPLGLSPSTIDEITNAEIRGSSEYQIKCDAGIRTNCLLVYQPELILYKRVLLSADGDYKLRNGCINAKRLVDERSEQLKVY